MKNTLTALLILVMVPFAGFSQGKPILNHIALYVQDLETSTTFYREVIGIDTIPEPFHDGRHTWFSIGAVGHLHLIAGGKAMFHDKNGHLCFSVESMDKMIQKLDKAKIPYENWAGAAQAQTLRVDGIRQIYFKDPDGNWIEINTDYK